MAEKDTKDLVFGKGIGVAAGFDLGAQKPLDSRATVATIADRDAHVTNNRAYPGMLVYVCEDEKTYQYTYNTDGNLIWVEFGFNNDKLQAEIVDSLESEASDKILSAKQGKVLKGLIDAEAGRADAAEKLNAAAAKAAQDDIDALEGYVGTFTHETAKTVVEYINAKTDGIATSGNLEVLAGRVTQTEKDIDAIEADYLKAADKTELANSIKAIADDYLKAADKQELSKAISDEKDRAMAAEKVNADAIALLNNNAETAGSVDYKIAQAVASIMENPDETMNSINELVTWVNEHAEDALELSNQVSANKGAIEKLNGTGEGSVVKAITDAIDAENLEQFALASDLDTAEGKIEALEGKVDVAKVSEAISNAIKAQDFSGFTTDAEHTELAGKVTTAEGKIAVLEAKFGDGEGSVADMIADAKQEAIDAAAEDATTKANKAKEDAIAEATRLDGLMDARVDAIEAVVETHALKSDVQAIDSRLTAATGANATEIKNIKNSMGAMSTQIGEKAAQTELDAAEERIATLEESDATHNTLLANLRTDVDAKATKEEHNALKALVGTTSVDSQIDAKITALDLGNTYEAKGTAVTEAGKVQTALDTYKTSNDQAVAAVKATADTAVQTVTAAADGGLKATRTGNDVVIAIDEALTFILDCGTSAE